MGIQQVEIRMRDNLLGLEYRNIWYGGNLDSDYADGVSIAEAIIDAYDANLAPVLDINWRLYAYGVREVSIAHMPMVVSTLVTPVSGTVSGGALPPQCAAFVSFRAVNTPPNKSNKWIPGIPEARQAIGVLDSTFYSGLVDFCVGLITYSTGTSDNLKLACVHWDLGADRVTIAHPIETYYTTNVVRTQRRRTIGVGL